MIEESAFKIPDAALSESITKSNKKKDDEDESSGDEDDPAEEDAKLAKIRAQRQEEQEYQDPEEGDEKEDNEDDKWVEEKENESKNDENDEDEDSAAVGNEEEEARLKEVLHLNEHIVHYRFDTENQLWCEVTLSYPIHFGCIDVYSLLHELPPKSVIYHIPGIKKGFTYINEGTLMLKTDGLNFSSIFSYRDLLDINKLHCNDIYAISQTYGIEAAARVLVKEVTDVFKVYGITVDPRHLLLIADYMTYDGTFKPLNRKGIEASSSPLQQMSFESSLGFLKSSVLNARTDMLQSPSASLITGLPCKTGTGAFSLIQKLF